MTEPYKINGESQLQVAIGVLLDSLSDKSSLVSETVSESIRKLSETYPNQILNSCCEFCQKQTIKTNRNHIAAVLSIMESVCTDYLLEIDGDTILLTIDFSLGVMTENVSFEPVQMPASGVLVALGRKHHIQVMDSLLKKLVIGVIPHFMLPHTLGALANTNAFGVVPYLKNILSIMLPLLGGLRSDSLKQAFSYALGSFCDALIEYVSNIDQAPDSTITTENFQIEVGMAYDVLFASWLHSREPKVVECVLDAISSIFPILSLEKVTQQTPKIIHALLNLYKKSIDSYHITKCLCAAIQKIASVNGTLLEPLLGNVLQHVSDLVCVNPDYAKPELLKCHSEVLRCYECFALHFTDHTIDQLINQLRNNNEKERVRALLVITHLTSYSTEQTIQRRFRDVIKYLNEMLNEASLRVKRALLKIIVAFASKGVFLNKEINPDGPDRYLEFILKLCCKQTLLKPTEFSNQEASDLQRSADNTLCMLSTSVPSLESPLWRLLMKCFLGPSYEDAILVSLRCLTSLSSRKTLPDNPETAAFIRCLALLSTPLPNLRGTYILNFLKNIKPCQSPKYKTVWDSKIPQLSMYLEQNYDHFNQAEWRDLIFDFLEILLESVDDADFNKDLIDSARQQLDIYDNNFVGNINNTKHLMNGSGEAFIASPTKQTEKHFLLRCLSVILCQIEDDAGLVEKTLNDILANAKLTDFSELNACAEAIGICSKSHLKLVLDRLSNIRHDVLSKKTSKFMHFPFMKDHKHDLGMERVRYVIVSSYSEICDRATSNEMLLKTVEAEILDFVAAELGDCKDFAIRRACLRAIGSVADAMHPDRNTLHVRMLDRDKIVDLVSGQIHLHSGPEYIELFPIVIPVITALIRLPPPLEFEQRFKLLKLCFDSVFNASAVYCRINSDGSENYYGDLKLVPFVTASFTKLNQLVQEILIQNLSPATLDEVVGLLEAWLGRRKQEQRLPAAETLRTVLQTYLDRVKFAFDCPTTFGQTGSLLAQIVPRCTDPNKNIRKVAVDCLYLVLCISARYEGHMRDHDKSLSNSLQHIQQQIDSDEPKLLFNLTSDLGHVVCLNLPHFQQFHFVDGLISALTDCEFSSSSGSSVVLNVVLKNKGGELQLHVGDIMEKIINQLRVIQCARTKASTLRAVLSLATHHPRVVGNFLLTQPLPFEQSICDCWSILSTDQTLVNDLLDHLKKTIKQSPPYEEQSIGDIKIATLQPLQAICVLHELLKNSQLKSICQQQFPELFSILLITLASYIGTSAPAIKSAGDKKDNSTNKYSFILNREALKLKPAKLALETFRLFLACCDFEKLSACLTSFTNVESEEEFPLFLDIVGELVGGVCLENAQCLSWLVACLGPSIRAEFEPQRVVVVAFLTQLLRHKGHYQGILTENLLEMILDVQMDQSCLVRKIALQGVGFAAEFLNVDLISRHCNPILSVLMNSLDYNSIGNESDVILEGMLSFSKLLTVLEGQKFSSCQVTAAVRIKPLFEQEEVQLRRAAFRLFGDLAASLGTEASNDAFKEQVQGNLVTLLLHLCDPDACVVKASKHTLRVVSIYLESPKVNLMIQEHLIEEASLNCATFIRDLIKLMAEELQDLFNLLLMTSLSYFKSPWEEIRSNAALMAGLLYQFLNNDDKHRALLDTVCDKLMRLLSDEDEEVRMRAVQAIPCLFVK